MYRSFLVVFFILTSFQQLNAQWVTGSIGGSTDLYAVHYFSSTDVYIGGINRYGYSTNTGSTWSLTDLAALGLFVYNIEDIYFTTGTNGFATGLFDGGNTEIILKTTNTGTSWTNAVSSTAPPIIRKTTAIDCNGTRLITVGNAGRIYRSLNSGSSWSLVTSGTTAALHDVKFASNDTIYVCGASRLLRSYNGGTTWTSLSVSGTYTDLACKNNVVYAIANASNVMRKSINSGVSYSPITLPFTAGQAIYAISKDTVLISSNDGIYITRDGGIGWEKFILSTYSPVNEFDFLNSNVGFGVGDNSYTIKTSNLSAAPAIPVSVFSITTASPFCLNDSIVFNNGTSPTGGYSYQWQFDGSTFSNTFNTGLKLTTAGNHTISLITTNLYGSDTFSLPITVVGYGLVPMSITVPDTICSGVILGFSLANSQTGANYQLRKGTTNIGTSKAGTGGTLEFSTLTPVTVSGTYNIKATNTNVCFVDTLTQYYPVIVTTGTGTPPAICTPTNSLCTVGGNDPGIINFSFGTINNTSTYRVNNYTNYACCEHTTVTLGAVYPVSMQIAHPSGEKVKIWIDYNYNNAFETSEEVFTGTANPIITGNITIAPGVFNTKLRMRVASDYSVAALDNACTDYSCGEIEDYSITIVPAPVPPTPSFNYSTTIACATTVNFTNTSYNAYTYVWDFGDGSPTSTATNPSHSFSPSGNYTVTLIATNPYGSDTTTQVITINNPVVPAATSCLPTLSACSGAPKITGLQIYEIGGWDSYWFSTLVQDYTCTAQFNLVSDTIYNFHVSGNGPDNWFIALIDKNNDGLFSTTGSECLTASCNYMLDIGTTGSGSPSTDAVSLIIPADAPDSTALRVRLYVRDAGAFTSSYCASFCGDYKDVTVFLTHRAVDANFTATPLNNCNATGPVNVTFNNSSRSDVAWLWDFGDGFTSASKNPSHAYALGGSYTVKLKVWDTEGNMDSLVRTNYIHVYPTLSPASISASGNLLSSGSTAVSYQWYLNSLPISGATDSTYTATGSGWYSVSLINGGICTLNSSPYYLDYVNANFSADTTVYCNVDSAQVSFNNTSIDATSFQWNFGDGSPISTTISPTHTYNAPGMYTVTLIACDTLLCDTLTANNYIVIDSTFFNAQLLPLTYPIFCTGDSLLLSGIISPGANYQWLQNGLPIIGADSNFIYATSGGNFSYFISNSLGCTDTSTSISIYTDTSCVWPGDADGNFVVDHFDLLPIGLFYGQNGNARSSVSNSWNPYPVINWGILQTSGQDIKHSDCNGNGLIDNSDTLAISLNYSSVHLLPPPISPLRSSNPDIYCQSTSTGYLAGNWVQIDIMAGTAIEQVTNLYGLGFTFNFDNSIIEPGTASMIYSDSWLTDLNTNGLTFTHFNLPTGELQTSLTRISHTGKSGFGKLGTFQFMVKSSLTDTVVSDFSITNNFAVNENGDTLNFDLINPFSLQFEPIISNSSEHLSNSNIQVYPNPFNEKAILEYTLEKVSNVRIEITNTLGEKIFILEKNNESIGKHTVELNNQLLPSNGVYTLNYFVNDNKYIRSIVKTK